MAGETEKAIEWISEAIKTKSSLLLSILPTRSWVQLKMNFNEFINQYRVEAFKKISKDPSKAHITLIGLAFECGFNSKTVFNTYFKKETGMTPKEFLKREE